ncbi:MAG: PAS domain S-box protein [Planctomycetales bacterium]
MEPEVDPRAQPADRDEAFARRVGDPSHAVSVLYDVASAANEAGSVDDAFRFALDRLCREYEWLYGHAFTLAGNGAPQLVPIGVWCGGTDQSGEELNRAHAAVRFAAGSGLPGIVLQTGQPAWTDDAAAELEARGIPAGERFGVRSGAAFPVLSGDRVLAVLEFFSTALIPHTEEMRELMTGVGMQLARALERRQARAALEESRRFTERIADSLPSIVCLYDLADRRPVYANRQIGPMLGYTLAELGRLGLHVIHPEDRPRIDQLRDRLSRASDDDVVESECRLRRADGRWGWFHARSVVFGRDDPEGAPRLVLCTVRDVTERKELERQIAQLVDQERLRLGQTLHDSLGQQLTGIGLLAERLRQQLVREGSHEAENAASLLDHVKDAQKQVRALARGLLPVEVDANGLMSALDKLVRDAKDLFGIDVEFRCVRPVGVEDNTTATHLYHIAQEAFHNALKHAAAQRIVVELRRDGEAVTLSVSDDGRGMARDEAATTGFGRRFMQYRADLIGATLSIRSAKGAGTTVTSTLGR